MPLINGSEIGQGGSKLSKLASVGEARHTSWPNSSRTEQRIETKGIRSGAGIIWVCLYESQHIRSAFLRHHLHDLAAFRRGPQDLAAGRLRIVLPEWQASPIFVYAIAERRLLPANTPGLIEFLGERLHRT